MLTKGWDSISIVKQEHINNSLTGTWSTVNSKFSRNTNEYNIIGEFSPWRIINGGGGRILRIEIPIESGDFSIAGINMKLDGTAAIVEITLSLLPEKPSSSILKTEYKKIAQSRSDMTKGNQGWILPITFIDPKGAVGCFSTVALDAIVHFLLDNPKNLELILAEINFAKSDSPDWARPKKCAYSYLDSGYLAILAVCTDRDITALPLDIDFTGIPDGGNSLYVMSAEMILKHLILPGLVEIYQNCSSSSFHIRERELVNKAALRMHSIKSGAIYYTPVVFQERNVARVQGDRVMIDYTGDCDLYAGISMDWNGWARINSSLGDKGVISFIQDGSSFSHNEDIPWYLKWLSPIVSVIVHVVVAVISDDLVKSIHAKSSQIKANSIDAVTWTKQQSIVRAVFLSESLILEY